MRAQMLPCLADSRVVLGSAHHLLDGIVGILKALLAHDRLEGGGALLCGLDRELCAGS